MCISKYVFSYIKNSEYPDAHSVYLANMMDMLIHEAEYEDADYLYLDNYSHLSYRTCVLCNEVSNLVITNHRTGTVLCTNNECILLRASLNIDRNAYVRHPNSGNVIDRKQSAACIKSVLNVLPKHFNGNHVTLSDIDELDLRMSILYIASIKKIINKKGNLSE